MATPQGEDFKKEITIVLAGKSGAGKSTLMNNLLDNKITILPSPDSTTADFVSESVTRNEVKINVIDTPGLIKNTKKQFKKLSRYITKAKADLLVYCVPVGTNNKFEEANPDIMKSLTDAYGKEIWKHCILVFTHSNSSLSMFNQADPATAIARFKDHIEKYAYRFEVKLHQLGVKQKVTTTLHLESSQQIPPDTIVATPVGFKPTDLQGLKYKLELPNGMDSANINWKDIAFILMVLQCNEECTSTLLKFRYGTVITRKILEAAAIGGAGGAIGSALFGATLGVTVGALLGPGGAVAGAVVGAIAGAAAGATVVGAVGGGVGAGKEILAEKKPNKEAQLLRNEDRQQQIPQQGEESQEFEMSEREQH